MAKRLKVSRKDLFKEPDQFLSNSEKTMLSPHIAGWTVESNIKMHVLRDIGEKPISSISKQDIISSLRKIETKGKYETCYRIRQKLEAIFSYAEIQGHCNSNPAKGLQQILTKPKPKSQNSLPISGKDFDVRFFVKYIAICLGLTKYLDLL